MSFMSRRTAAAAAGAMSFMLVTWASAAGGQGPGDPGSPAVIAPGTLLIGPVQGLTTDWHPSPAATGFPVDHDAVFKVAAPATATVKWHGATETARDSQWSTAVCPVHALGKSRVAVTVKDGATTALASCDLLAVATQPAEVTVAPIQLIGGSPTSSIDDTQPQEAINEATVGLYFGPSIATISQASPGVFTTSIGRMLNLSVASVTPAVFTPLIEWRVNGKAIALGKDTSTMLFEIGSHAIQAGPPAAAPGITVDTYRVTITPLGDPDKIADGPPLVFLATTEPPGHEGDVTWLAATKYGHTDSIVAQGPVFFTAFHNTWGPSIDPGYTWWRWVGVKADNAVQGQDQKGQTRLYQQMAKDPKIELCEVFDDPPPPICVDVLCSALFPDAVCVWIKKPKPGMPGAFIYDCLCVEIIVDEGGVPLCKDGPSYDPWQDDGCFAIYGGECVGWAIVPPDGTIPPDSAFKCACLY